MIPVFFDFSKKKTHIYVIFVYFWLKTDFLVDKKQYDNGINNYPCAFFYLVILANARISAEST